MDTFGVGGVISTTLEHLSVMSACLYYNWIILDPIKKDYLDVEMIDKVIWENNISLVYVLVANNETGIIYESLI